ncbi:PQQ-binding-like beta-propeller repeat protein [Acidobacteriota bacterium]
MKKIALILLILLSLSFCSLFKAKILPYPTGIIFPLEEASEIICEGEIIEFVHKEGDFLYLSTRKGIVYCINGRKGKVLWKYQAPGPLASAPYLGQLYIYVLDEKSTVYCLDRKGTFVWKKRFEEKITGGVGEYREKVYLGNASGLFFALDSSDGKEVWRFQAGGAIRSSPVIANDMIIFGCDDHILYFLSEEGEQLAQFEAKDKIRSVPLVDEKALYFGSDDHYIYCVDIKRKKKKWKVKTGGKIQATPIMDKRRVYFLSLNNVLYCLNKKNGTILWWQKLPARTPFHMEIVDKRILVTAFSPRLICFDTLTGKEVGIFDARQEIRSNPIWLDPYLLITLYDEQEDTGNLVFLGKEVKVYLLPSKEPPQKTKEEIVFTAAATAFFKPEYEFYVKEENQKKIVQEKSEISEWTWFPEKEGTHHIGVLATDAKERAEFEMPYVIKDKKKAEKQNKMKGDLIMNREEALALVKKHLKNKNLIKHSLAVEACMRELASKLDQDVEKWSLAGILHDLDYEITEKSPELHSVETVRILKELNMDPDIIRAIQAHAGAVPCQTDMEWAIFSIDPLTGLIIAATLMHPSKKLKEVDLEFVKRRYKEKSFAKGARREDIEQIKNIDMELDEFISICLKAMQGIDKDLGL